MSYVSRINNIKDWQKRVIESLGITLILTLLCWFIDSVLLIFFNFHISTNLIVSILIAVIIIGIIVYNCFIFKPKINGIKEKIESDGTKIIYNNGEIYTFHNTPRNAFISLTVPQQEQCNILHFAILGKLKQLQNFGIVPLIFLYNPFDNNVDLKVFEKLISYFLLKGKYRIIKMRDADSYDALNKLLNCTTFGEIKEKLRPQDETKAYDIFIAILEMAFVFKKQGKSSTAVICGEDIMPKLEFGRQKLGIKKPYFLQLPNLLGFTGEKASRKNIDNTLNFKHNEKKQIEININQCNNLDVLKQIYSFFIIPIWCEKSGKKIEIKTINNQHIAISERKDVEKIMQCHIEYVKCDLTNRIPGLMQEIIKAID